jgi:hypothetical protein
MISIGAGNEKRNFSHSHLASATMNIGSELNCAAIGKIAD